MAGRDPRRTGQRRGVAALRGAILAAGASLCLVVSACGAPGLYAPPDAAGQATGSPGAPGTSGGVGSSVPTTAWGRAVAGIRPDGTVPLETALAAFSVAFGPIPGVETPEGDPEVIGSASGPTRWILNHWDELTSDQQAAVHGYLAVDGPASAQAGLIAAAGPVTADVLDQSGFKRLADEMVAKVGAKLNRTLGVPVDVVFRDLPPPKPGDIIYANTVPLDAAGEAAVESTPKMARCQVQVGKATQALDGVVEQEAVLAHEVFHCYQYALATKLADAKAMPAWLAEGAGAWVGEEIAAGGSTIGNHYWLGWMSQPKYSLFEREYSAIGFFAHLKTSGVDVWSLLDKMQLAAIGKSADAYLIAVGGAQGDTAIDAWAPSYVSDQGLGTEWFMDGPGKPPGSIALFYRAGMVELDQYPIFEDPVTAYPLRLTVDSEVFVVKPFVAPRGLMYDKTNGQQKLADVAGMPFCLKSDDCSCPEGSPGEAFQFKKLSPGEEFYLGFSGHTDGINVDLLTFSLETTCVQAPEDFALPFDCHCAPGPLGIVEPRPSTDRF